MAAENSLRRWAMPFLDPSSRVLKGILDQLNYLGGIGPLCTHVQVLATWTHLNGWLEYDVFAIGLQHSPQLEHFIACP